MQTVRVRLLAPGDEPVLALLDREDAAFDVAGRGGPRGAPARDDAAAYLADPTVLHWVAEERGEPVGHLLCYLQRRRRGDAQQVLVYEIGVRADRRRRGIGRLLLAELDRWMAEHGVRQAWVPSTEDAEPFYRACGFERDADQPVQLVRRR